MADEIRINRASPANQPAARPETVAPAETTAASKGPWIILVVVILALLVLGALFRDKLFGNTASKTASSSKTGSYQAVFLTNGQVYFGKLSNPTADYVTLDDIYYLQVGPQQGSGTTGTSTPGQEIHLVKLGQELHGPVDEMHISRSQVLFYEDLKSDGSVVTAITKDKTDKAAAPAK